MSDQVTDNAQEEAVVTEPVAETTETVETTTSEPATAEATPEIRSSDDLRKYKEDLKAKETVKAKETTIKPKQSKPVFDPKFGAPEKQYEELKKIKEQQAKELGELRKWQKDNQQKVESYNKFLAQQQEKELIEKYQTNPEEAINESANRRAQAQLEAQMAPYRESINKAQAVEIHSSLQEISGEEFETLAPVMADIIDQFQQMDEANGTTNAAEVARNPQLLRALARDHVAETNKKQSVQQKQVSQQVKANNLKIASGVARNSNVSAAPTEDLSSLSIDEMRLHLKKNGILKDVQDGPYNWGKAIK